MPDIRKPGTSKPFEYAVGLTSPVQRALRILRRLVSRRPIPKANTEAARSGTALLGTHMLHLLEGAGLLNSAGHHSAAVALFRPLEDTFDCFAAAGLVPGAAEKWLERNLKPSDAARLWVGEFNDNQEFVCGSLTLADYRKTLRTQFNEYSHCSPTITDWNLLFAPVSAEEGTLELNLDPQVIDANAHRIDAHLTACIWEFTGMAEQVFDKYLGRNKSVQAELTKVKSGIKTILERHKEHGCFDVLGAAELKRLGLLPQFDSPP